MQGKHVSLRPLQPEDANALWDLIGTDEDTWRWVGVGSPPPNSSEDLQMEFQRKNGQAGSEYFAIVDNQTSMVVGSTAFLDIRPSDRHLEIGSTFIAPDFRGGHRNIETKLLMLTEAFEVRNAVRVTIKANSDNFRSRAAIEKIGAKLEGLLRNQRLERDGTWRTAAYYSVILEEWPDTKSNLKTLLAL